MSTGRMTGHAAAMTGERGGRERRAACLEQSATRHLYFHTPVRFDSDTRILPYVPMGSCARVLLHSDAPRLIYLHTQHLLPVHSYIPSYFTLVQYLVLLCSYICSYFIEPSSTSTLLYTLLLYSCAISCALMLLYMLLHPYRLTLVYPYPLTLVPVCTRSVLYSHTVMPLYSGTLIPLCSCRPIL